MAFIICSPSAACAIKSYSPDIIVLPYLSSIFFNPLDKFLLKAIERSNSVIIGPGLSKDPNILLLAEQVAHVCIDLQKVLIIDGDAIQLLKRSSSIPSYPFLVITPNYFESLFLFKEFVLFTLHLEL